MATTFCYGLPVYHPSEQDGINTQLPITLGIASNQFHEIILQLIIGKKTSQTKLQVIRHDFDSGDAQVFKLDKKSASQLHSDTVSREKVGIFQWQYAQTLLNWADEERLSMLVKEVPKERFAA